MSKPTYDELVLALQAATISLNELTDIIEKRRKLWLWRYDIPMNEEFYRNTKIVTDTVHRLIESVEQVVKRPDDRVDIWTVKKPEH